MASRVRERAGDSQCVERAGDRAGVRINVSCADACESCAQGAGVSHGSEASSGWLYVTGEIGVIGVIGVIGAVSFTSVFLSSSIFFVASDTDQK